jgi:hypothetical protein
VVSRPRASFDAGLLMPRLVSQSLLHPCECSKACAFILGAPCDAPKNARRLCIIPKGWPRLLCARLSTLTACSPSRCLKLRSPFGAHRSIRVRVLPSSAHAFAQTSLGFLLRVHDQELLAEYTFSCLPCSPLDAHGQHFIGSQSTGSRIRVTFRRVKGAILFLLKIVPFARTRQSRPPSPFDDGARRAVQRRVSCPSFDVHVPRFSSPPRPPFDVHGAAVAAR